MLNLLQSHKKKKKTHVEVNPLESIQELGSDIVDTLEHQAADGAKDLWAQLVGKYEEAKPHLGGDLTPGQEVDVAHLSVKDDIDYKGKASPHIEAGIDYGKDYFREVVHGRERAQAKENHEIKAQVEQILDELKRLVDSSTVLEAQFMAIAVDEAPVTPGKYHLTFFEWMLNVIQNARMKVEDSGAWLSAMSGKGNKKNYWSMFKKHGTSFGLSGERTVATQTG